MGMPPMNILASQIKQSDAAISMRFVTPGLNMSRSGVDLAASAKMNGSSPAQNCFSLIGVARPNVVVSRLMAQWVLQ